MDKVVTNWLDAIASEQLDAEDVERSLRYAKDLEQGLAKIRTFAQGVAIFGSARLDEDSKWSQLAEKLGITDRAVSKWETGKSLPDASIMLEMCALLGITVNDLLCGEVVSMENYNEQMENSLIEMIMCQ